MQKQTKKQTNWNIQANLFEQSYQSRIFSDKSRQIELYDEINYCMRMYHDWNTYKPQYPIQARASFLHSGNRLYDFILNLRERERERGDEGEKEREGERERGDSKTKRGEQRFKVKDRVCFAPVFITYNKLYMYIASIFCKTSVTSVLYH